MHYGEYCLNSLLGFMLRRNKNADSTTAPAWSGSSLLSLAHFVKDNLWEISCQKIHEGIYV